MAKKLALVTFSFQGAYGGIRLIEENVRRLTSWGWEVHLFAQQLDEIRSEHCGAILHKISRPRLRRYQRIQWFNWRAQRRTRQGFDLVVGHAFTRNQDVLHIHNCFALEAERTGNHAASETAEARYQAKCLSGGHFRYLVANSRLEAVDVAARYGIAPERIEVVFPGVDIEQFRPCDGAFRVAVRERLGLPQEKTLVALVTSGNFRKRGVDRLIQAMGRLHPDDSQRAALLVVGNDRDMQTYRTAAEQLPIESFFLPSQRTPEDVFASVDILAHPARVEEFGMVVLEAMACGCPVLLNQWVGAAELIPDPWRHFVSVDHNDSAELAQHITKLINDSDLRVRFGQALREVATNHTWHHNTQQHLAVYERAIQENANRDD